MLDESTLSDSCHSPNTRRQNFNNSGRYQVINGQLPDAEDNGIFLTKIGHDYFLVLQDDVFPVTKIDRIDFTWEKYEGCDQYCDIHLTDGKVLRVHTEQNVCILKKILRDHKV